MRNKLNIMIAFVALFVFALAPAVFAGPQFSLNDFEIDSNGQMSYKSLIEVATTSDTVTAAETGKTFFPNISSGTITFTLPTAAAGLTYTFTSINGHATSGQGTVILSPQATDTFVGCVNSSSTSTFTTGDDLDSPQATGDSVTLVGASTKWYCTNRVGTWVDGN